MPYPREPAKDAIMNEIKVAVSRKAAAAARPPLPLFRFNRRFVICCALCAATLQLALAEASPDHLPYGRVPIGLLPANPAIVSSEPVISKELALTESEAWLILKPYHRRDARSRRDRFESEFGIDGKRQTGLMGSLQLAKYALDDATFTVDDFTRSVSDALKFDYDRGGFHRAAATDQNQRHTLPGPWAEMPRGVRFGPELSLTGGKPYVGLVVTVPFGN
jgi:hypothetical protein